MASAAIVESPACTEGNGAPCRRSRPAPRTPCAGRWCCRRRRSSGWRPLMGQSTAGSAAPLRSRGEDTGSHGLRQAARKAGCSQHTAGALWSRTAPAPTCGDADAAGPGARRGLHVRPHAVRNALRLVAAAVRAREVKEVRIEGRSSGWQPGSEDPAPDEAGPHRGDPPDPPTRRLPSILQPGCLTCGPGRTCTTAQEGAGAGQSASGAHVCAHSGRGRAGRRALLCLLVSLAHRAAHPQPAQRTVPPNPDSRLWQYDISVHALVDWGSSVSRLVLWLVVSGPPQIMPAGSRRPASWQRAPAYLGRRRASARATRCTWGAPQQPGSSLAGSTATQGRPGR